MRDEIAPQQTTPAKTTDTPWQYLGISRSTWYRLMAADQAPLPLALPGRNRWRISDLDKWLERQKQVRHLRRLPEHVLEAARAARRKRKAAPADGATTRADQESIE
jgi:predicted DNA-binding transcriptional regulator AlpA